MRREILACYPGSFDPLTYGHLDLIRRGVELFDRLIVAVGRNVIKSPLFSAEERAEMLRGELAGLDRVEVEVFSGLVVEFCHQRGLNVILRGLRTISDFEAEYQMALTNRSFDARIETVFVMPAEKYSFLSSSLIKEVVSVGGTVKAFVPPAVEHALKNRIGPGEA